MNEETKPGASAKMPVLKTKAYTKEEVQALMNEKNFWEQFEGEIRKDGGATRGKLRRASLVELVSAFAAKVVDPKMTPPDAFCVDGEFNLTPEQIDGLFDPLGTVILAAGRQALRQLFQLGGTSDFARFADCAKLQVHDPDPANELKVKIVLQFHIWYATTVDGFEPRRAN